VAKFEKGNKAGKGRPPGSLNKTTVALKQAMLQATANAVMRLKTPPAIG
jgi:hypothetical protein